MVKQGYTELTLDLLQKSPEAGYLLVQLHDKHKLYSLAKTRHPEARAELAELMSELLTIGLKPPENELVIDVLMSLIRQAEQDLKQAVAERLASMDEAPLRLAVHLANDEITVAAPILRRSRVLNDTDLLYIVKSQTEGHWRAIAGRAQMSSELINALVDTKDMETAITLSENKNVTLTGHAMNTFSDMATISDRLARPLLMRHELPNKLATKLYSYVGMELKNYIKQNFDVSTHNLVEQTVDDIVFEIAAQETGEYAPTIKMVVAAENMLEKGFLNTDVLIENLRRGQISNFVALFSVYCGLSANVVVEILQQKSAQGLDVACKATGILKPEFVNIFLLTSRLRGGKVIDQNDLARALGYYDKINEKLAKQILNQSRH